MGSWIFLMGSLMSSPFQKGVSLVFISKHQTDYVDDVLLISEPIKNIQDPMERYGLK